VLIRALDSTSDSSVQMARRVSMQEQQQPRDISEVKGGVKEETVVTM
jgi:hypothetical protein